MRIVTATEDTELQAIAELCSVWAKDMKYDVSNQDIFTDLDHMRKRGTVLYVKDEEKILGVMSGLPVWHFWVKEFIAHEHWFFVHPEHRGKKISSVMETAFSAWAKSKGCSAVIMSPNRFGSNDPKVISGALMRRGYKVHGYTLMKRI